MKDKIRIYHLTELKYRRRDLRKKSTKAESLLWNEIRDSKLGVKFRRQYSVMGYVVEFYCSKNRLGVELEGGIHRKSDVKAYDKYRKEYLEALNIRMLFFKNEEVESNLDNILNTIRKVIIRG